MQARQVERIIAGLTGQVGTKGVATDPHELAPWLTDWRGRWTGRALAMVSPASTEEVAAIVRIAAAHRLPVVPQGGNTGMVGGATPSPDGDALLLSLRRMTSIIAIDNDHMTVEAGVVLQSVHERAARAGMRFPLTLGARGSATIGGLVSTNAGGTQVLRWGTMRALTLGLEAVLPSGDVWRGLVPLKKDNRGYDLNQLLIGAEGTLGIVTAACLRLVPAVADRAVAWIGVSSPHHALDVLRAFEHADRGIESFELVPGAMLARVVAHVPGGRMPLNGADSWAVLVELVAASDARARLETLITDVHARGMISDATIAANEAQANAFWTLRDSISASERAAGPAIQHDISVPIEAMPAFMEETAAAVEAAFTGTHASGFGHLGDGNVHFHVRAPAGVDEAEWRAGQGAAASRMVHDLVTAAGGSISAEHGIGQMKRDELARLGDPVRLAAMRAIKAALDPLGIMNPGKLL